MYTFTYAFHALPKNVKQKIYYIQKIHETTYVPIIKKFVNISSQKNLIYAQVVCLY